MLKCCYNCMTNTPAKFYGCSSPCFDYKGTMAKSAEQSVNETSKTSVELIKLADERESLRSD